jgi:hypothetical protein
MHNGATLDNSVSVIYSGTGSTATFVFKIKTYTSFATKNLKIKCIIPGTGTNVISN